MLTNNTPDALFKHNPALLATAFDLWETRRYKQYKKALFFSDEISAEDRSLLLAKVKNFRFEPDVIQYIGALRDAQGKMKYDESFLNMLQRIDFQSLKYSLDDIAYHRQPLFSVKGSIFVIAVIKQMLQTWCDDVHVDFVN